MWWFIILGSICIFGIIALFKKNLNISEPFYKVKVIFFRFFALVVSVGGLTLFLWLGTYNYFLDIPAYLNKDYKVVNGIVEIKKSSIRGYVTQYLTINR
ncbi:hypothetical protein [Neobacillus sp. LXY-1]|uniref:hypothetical protein n=1 Tax=Neobacillus sp. LXY-1 TaxID=3379133 RepID=UPI003EE2BF9E